MIKQRNEQDGAADVNCVYCSMWQTLPWCMWHEVLCRLLCIACSVTCGLQSELKYNQSRKGLDTEAGLTRDWCELLPAEPWLLVSISALVSKCACAAARTLASHAIGEEWPELSLPLHHSTATLGTCAHAGAASAPFTNG